VFRWITDEDIYKITYTPEVIENRKNNTDSSS